MTAEPQWFKSSHSSNGGDCIEAAGNLIASDTVPVRDSKDTEGPALPFPAEAWQSFVSALRAGEFGTA
ncbi:DUF397 domain-containing protein [Kitasatospora sp. NBC_01300]|uniref:DUF397 domain-containing protein n=1 Tax=Kitasatospora sp. NBC_01300 TaxID=2903574 RepID=UPI00352FB2CF|nr:DUF397 domain-containing protein [Kitasatospora sp. NBC_01300]